MGKRPGRVWKRKCAVQCAPWAGWGCVAEWYLAPQRLCERARVAQEILEIRRPGQNQAGHLLVRIAPIAEEGARHLGSLAHERGLDLITDAVEP